MITLKSAVISLASLAIANSVLASPSPRLNARAVSYHQIARFEVGGEGSWDYLKVDFMHRLFVSRGTHTMVLDTATGRVLGDIPDTTGVHGIAFSPRIGRGYTSNGRDNTVTEFNLQTLQVVKKIPVSGQNPDCIIFEPKTRRIFTCNGRSGDVSAIDVLTEKEVGKVAIGGKLEFAASDPQGHVFVNNESTSEVVEFDAATLQIIKKWSIAPAEGPSGLAIDAKHNRVFSVTDGKMAISDTVEGKVIATVSIGDGPDAAAFDSKLGLVFSSNGESGTLTVVQAGAKPDFPVLQTVTTELGARTMALDESTHIIYLVTAKMETPKPGAPAGKRRETVPNSFVVLVYAP